MGPIDWVTAKISFIPLRKPEITHTIFIIVTARVFICFTDKPVTFTGN